MSKIITDEKRVEEILSRGVHEVVTKEELKKKMLSGKKLHLKLGIDVTGPLIHLGHSVVQRKLRDFQELGHEVTLIIGDFTTLVGDHSDKVDMRAETTSDTIRKDEETYKEQFFKTVIKEQTHVRHNSEWLKKLKFNDVIELARQFTISQMLDRETFMLRYKEQKPIGLDEFLYPLMQGYDSVALKCDVEFGGTDQTFNLLAGRKLMGHFDQTPQSAVIMRLLTGSDGRPMGKSLKNFIPVMENAVDMYGKLMSIVDDVLWEYFELVTRVSMDEIEKMKRSVQSGENPMIFKKRLAKEVVTFYHSSEEAEKAEKAFVETVQKGQMSEEFIIDTTIKGNMSLLDFLRQVKTSSVSTSDIKRVVEQGGVEIDGEKIVDFTRKLDFLPGMMIKFGKREFIRVS